MIDCHWAIRLDNRANREQRDQYVEWMRSEADALGVERLCLITRRANQGTSQEGARANNRLLGKLIDEHPDFLHAWCRACPKFLDDPVAELRQSVEADGLLGLKWGPEVNCADPQTFPLFEAAIDMDVPVKIHTAQRTTGPPDRFPDESFSDDVVTVAERYPELKILASHISAPGDWEYRIKNIEHLENVHLDISGTGCEAGMLELAAERLGVDRLVYGSDNIHLPCHGKLLGTELTPAEKATIAFNMNDLLADDDPRKLSEAERQERETELAERLREYRPVPSGATVVDANAYLGNWAFRDLSVDAADLIETMDKNGVSQAVVSSVEAATYRNPEPANRKLAERVEGYEDRLIPVATLNPMYAAWESDFEDCLDELGMQGVRILPAYNDYSLTEPAVEALARRCAERDVPLFIVSVLEDQRQRHPRFEIEGVHSYRMNDERAEEVVELLNTVPEVDVVIADAWTSAFDIAAKTSAEEFPPSSRGTWERPGKTLFVVDDLSMWYVSRGERIVEEIGAEKLVCGPQLPFKYFPANYNRVEHLPVDEDEREAIRSGNLLALFE
ncbi:amidohydrolase family protein [Haloarchaeobius sp. TZWSO28]|uniref:amidohydrolase family protein n=1 Tax=Haloarchaeobius sp. TZWSO28 TaxID=3446119 RepID=UPI003EC03BC0